MKFDCTPIGHFYSLKSPEKRSVQIEFVVLQVILAIMCDLNKKQLKVLNDMAVAGAPPAIIADRMQYSVSTVYLKLEQLFPRDGSVGQIKSRTRRTGAYKATAQTKALMAECILQHRFATNKDLIGPCRLQTSSEATISRWLVRTSEQPNTFRFCDRISCQPASISLAWCYARTTCLSTLPLK